MRKLTEAQEAWLRQFSHYEPIGPPRSGVRFVECGTLYADGSFVKLEPMKPIVLREGCFGVGIRISGK